MYITFDYKCPDCGHVDSRFVKKSEMDEQYHERCPDSRGFRMLRLPAGTRTTFRFADRRLKR
jgi:hypothetical protein